MPVITGAAEYPKNLKEKMIELGINVDALDALKLAKQAGFSKAANIVLMGRCSNYFDFGEDEWIDAIKNTVKEEFFELNKNNNIFKN